MVLSYGCMWNSCESYLVHFKAGQNPNKSTMLKKMLAKLNAGFFHCSTGSSWSLIIMTFQPMVPASGGSTNQNFRVWTSCFPHNSLSISPCAMTNASARQEL